MNVVDDDNEDEDDNGVTEKHEHRDEILENEDHDNGLEDSSY